MQALTAQIIASRLAQVHEPPSEESYLSAFLSDAPRPAAVLVPFLLAPLSGSAQSEWHILLTRRSDRLPEHSGQVAFPGGASDPVDDSPEATALREAQEEIGLHPSHVQILGRLNSVWSITNYSVTPVVGLIPWPYAFQVQTDEVSRVFTVPLAWLADPAHHEVRQRPIPPPYSQYLHTGGVSVTYFQPYDGELLWGMSAGIVINLLKVLYG